jgi:hypothetical protein
VCASPFSSLYVSCSQACVGRTSLAHRIFWSSGSAYAAVLPDPVRARHSRSFPYKAPAHAVSARFASQLKNAPEWGEASGTCRARGMACAWTGVGLIHPARARARASRGSRPSASNRAATTVPCVSTARAPLDAHRRGKRGGTKKKREMPHLARVWARARAECLPSAHVHTSAARLALEPGNGHNDVPVAGSGAGAASSSSSSLGSATTAAFLRLGAMRLRLF